MKASLKGISLVGLAAALASGAQAGGDSSIGGSDNLNLLRGRPVVTSPYVGQRAPRFDAFGLTTFIPKVHQDMRLLQQQQSLEETFSSRGIKLPGGALVDMSGRIESRASFMTNKEDNWNLGLVGAEVDFAVRAGKVGAGFMQIAYNDAESGTNSHRTDPSQMRLKQAYFSVGNFNQMPFYATVGQFHQGFGQYSSSMLFAPLTWNMSNMLKHGLALGFQSAGDNHVHAVVYGFRGDLRFGNEMEFGGHAAYHFDKDGMSGYVGAGLVSNFAEGAGFIVPSRDAVTVTDDPTPSSYGFMRDTRMLTERVMGANIQAKYSYRNVGLVLEGVGAVKKFSIDDLQFKDAGAQPLALNAEVSYEWKNYSKPLMAAVGFGMTYEASALGLPKYRIAGAVTTAWFPSTIQAFGVRYDKSYDATDVGQFKTNVVTPKGKESVVATLHFGYYF